MENKKVQKKIKKEEDKQFFWFIAIVILCFSAFLIPYFYTQSQKTFNYLGLKWDVQIDGKKQDQIEFYHTYVPKIYKGKNYGTHNFYLRNDPRKNDIEVNITELLFLKQYIATMTPEILECENQNLAAFALGDLTSTMPFIMNVSGATTEKEYATTHNILYTNCEDAPAQTTIVQMQKGNETKIFLSPENPNCYIIQIENCEDNLKAVERLIIETIDKFGYKIE